MELSLVVIFWYGIVHAFGPDHLSAIADFSVGKNQRKTLLITFLFALGHGISLFVFAKLLESMEISQDLLAYGDIVSAGVIISMGVYILFMVATERIQLRKHIHENKEHIHIWYGKSHEHSDDSVAKTSSLTLGLLMGAGGVRGMLITLGAVNGGTVDFMMVGAFTLGVMLIFGAFGMVMLYVNQNLLRSLTSVRRTFTTVGLISIAVGTNILLG
jgi:ABC-type nickel/cobalt efflux system permease component RcnA